MKLKLILVTALLCLILVASQEGDAVNSSSETTPDTTYSINYDDLSWDSENTNSSENVSSNSETSYNDDLTWDDDDSQNNDTVSEKNTSESEVVNQQDSKTELNNEINDSNSESDTMTEIPESPEATGTPEAPQSSGATESQEATQTTVTTENSQTVDNNNASNINSTEQSFDDDITWDEDSTNAENNDSNVNNENTLSNSVGVEKNASDSGNSTTEIKNESTTQNTTENIDMEWETLNDDSSETNTNVVTGQKSKEASNDKFLSQSQSLDNPSNTNELNFEEPNAEDETSKESKSGISVKCFWFNGHNETFDLSPLDDKNADKKIEVTATKNYYYNFCNPTKAKCNDKLNLMNLVKDDKCSIMAGDNDKTFSEFEKMTKKEIVDEKEKEIIVGLRVKLATGEKCSSDETKTYQTTWEITCDDDKDAKKGVITVLNAAELDLDQPGRLDKCGIVVKAKSVHGCPLSNYYAVSAFIEANRIIFMIVIVVIGIFLTYLGSKIINITLMITAFFATVIGVFLVVFGIFGAYKISNGIMWLIFSLTIVLACGVGFLFYKFKQIFTISLGALTGYFCSMMLYNFVLRYIKSNPDVVYWVTLVVCIALGVLVAIYLEKHLIITSTALLGGYATVRGASLVIGGFPPESEVIDLIRKGEFYQLSLVSN